MFNLLRCASCDVLEGGAADDITLPQYLHELSLSVMDEVSCVIFRIITYIKAHFSALTRVTNAPCVVVTNSVTDSFCVLSTQ